MQKGLATMTAAKVEGVPNPLPNHVFTEVLSRKIKISESSVNHGPRIAMVFNGLEGWKNGAVGLRAFALIRKHLPEAQLYLFGQGAAKDEEASQFAAATGLSEGICFIGRLAHQQLLQQLSTCDVLLHPSLEESFGAVLIEAMSQGVPVIGGQTSGAVPWVVGKNGSLVDVTSPQEIAQAALDLLRYPEQLTAMGNEARKNTLARFSADAVATAYENHYRQATSGVRC
jgi:glycosyltransferase involved in cell wall biosynthesis